MPASLVFKFLFESLVHNRWIQEAASREGGGGRGERGKQIITCELRCSLSCWSLDILSLKSWLSSKDEPSSKEMEGLRQTVALGSTWDVRKTEHQLLHFYTSVCEDTKNIQITKNMVTDYIRLSKTLICISDALITLICDCGYNFFCKLQYITPDLAYFKLIMTMNVNLTVTPYFFHQSDFLSAACTSTKIFSTSIMTWTFFH